LRSGDALESYTADEYRTWIQSRQSTPSTHRKHADGNIERQQHRRGKSISGIGLVPTYSSSGGGSAAQYLPLVTKNIDFAKDTITSRDQAGTNSRSILKSSTLASRSDPRLFRGQSLEASFGGGATGEQFTGTSSSSLTKQPLKIKVDEFRVHQSSALAAADEYTAHALPHGPGIDGLLYVHIYCGHGLKTARTTMRDLYCVVSVDSVNRARTGLRSGAINFDWDEDFEVDLLHSKRVSFSIYSWDQSAKQKLCFSTSLLLSEFLQHGSQQSLALRLDPTGILYIELIHYDLVHRFRRKPNPSDGAIFGCNLENLVAREDTGDGIPIVVRRCVEDIELRGLKGVGLYRLCGSAKRQNQLKAQLEADVKNVKLSPTGISDISIITGELRYCYVISIYIV